MNEITETYMKDMYLIILLVTVLHAGSIVCHLGTVLESWIRQLIGQGAASCHDRAGWAREIPDKLHESRACGGLLRFHSDFRLV